MRQVLFTIPIFGGIKVFGYGAMLVLAFIGSTWLATWRRRREKLDPEVILDMAFWIFFIGLVGCAPVLLHPVLGQGHRQPARRRPVLEGGIVYYGGILGGVLAFFVYRHLRPFPLRPYLDVMAPPIMVGTLFGRLGCFLNGCCYGDVCSLPWAVSFPKPSPPWDRQFMLGLIPPDGHPFAPPPPDPDLLGPRRPGHPHPPLGLLPAPPPRRRGDGPADDHLPDHPLPDRVSPQRRGGLLRRFHHLAEYQHRPLRVRAGVLVLAFAAAADSLRRPRRIRRRCHSALAPSV